MLVLRIGVWKGSNQSEASTPRGLTAHHTTEGGSTMLVFSVRSWVLISILWIIILISTIFILMKKTSFDYNSYTYLSHVNEKDII